MGSIYSTFLRCGFLILIAVCSAFTIPPYMWYATYSVENYSRTGCSIYANLGTAHEDATGFANAVNSAGLPCDVSYRYNRRDAECVPSRWTGYSAELNYVDFLFYAGHGCGTGPYLGCDQASQITSYSDIRFGGYGYLKWVQAAACNWFVVDSLDVDCGSGLSEFDRWNNCFQGVHVIQGHRAATYEHRFYDSMSEEFWNRWVYFNNTVHSAWKNAQIKWVYEKPGYRGLQPASAAADYYYITELWQDANDAPAPSGMGCLVWATVGNPQY
ncbi:MAG: hypothetical protein GX267_01615 [Fibrobacter sp.]|jgi:hypothetical protein|nr:hypothetical protein [Fibrobacter sp.]